MSARALKENRMPPTPLDPKTADQALQTYIRPQTFPVAVRMLRPGEPIPERAKRPARDFQKLSIPGTQLKEAILPAPIISVATGLGHGLNLEAYYQFLWYENRLPPVGTYFSVADILGGGRGMPLGRGGTGGRGPLYLDGNPASPDFVNFGGLDPSADPAQANTIAVNFARERRAKASGQFGAAMHYKPQDLRLDLGVYFLNYHDKMPVLEARADGQLQWKYLENRQLYGASANFPLGNWAVGMELSYRPKEAVSLSSCYGQGGALDSITNGVVGIECPMWIDKQKYQAHLTGILLLTPGDHGWFLDLLGAQTGAFTGEAVWIYFPGVSSRASSMAECRTGFAESPSASPRGPYARPAILSAKA